MNFSQKEMGDYCREIPLQITYEKRSRIKWRAFLTVGLATILCFVTAWQPTPLYAQSGPICFGVTDGSGNQNGGDTLVSLDVVTGSATTIGGTNTFNIEAIAFSEDGQTLYAADAETLGTLNLATGAYTGIGAFGSGDGAAGTILFDDVDSLTFDIETDTLFGSLRRPGGLPDLLFKIDPATGAIVQDGFGAGVDYVVVPVSATGEHDIDDLAANPYTGVLYGVINSGGQGGTLVRIDKATGAIEEVGPLGSSDIEGLGFARDGTVATLYGSTGDNGPIEADNNDLYLIDETNGNSTLVDGLPETDTLRDYESLDCIYQTGNIGDTIWSDDDQDGNGIVDGDDVVLPDVVVNLVDSNGNIVATDTTDANGNYLFENVSFGTYTVQVDTTTLPLIKQGNPAFDPDGNDDNQSTVTISVDDPNNFEQDFAYYEQLGVIGDTIFHDANSDGVLNPDDGDFPLPGVTVTLTDEDGATQTAVTDSNGNYLFSDLPLDATYTVIVDTTTLPAGKLTDPTADPDGVLDSTSEVTLTPANSEDLDQDFGYEPAVGSVGDTIFHDANSDGVLNPDDGDFPLPGVTVTLIDEDGATQTAVTDGNGTYLFSDLPLDATYTVIVDTTTLPADKVTDPTADPDGVLDSTSEVTLTPANPDNLDQDFGYEPAVGSVGDTIFHDANGDGVLNPDDGDFPLPGVTVTLTDEDGLAQTAVTDENGSYLFTELPLDATYTVVVDTTTLPESKLTDPTADPDGVLDSTSEVTLTPADPDNLDQDFGYEPAVGSVGDTIFHDANGDGVLDPAAGDFPLAGVTVTLTDEDGATQTAVTDENGSYLFDELPLDATYTVVVDTTTLPAGKITDPTADPDGGADSTSEVTLTPADPDNLDQDFGYEPAVGSVGDTIFHDANGDGVFVLNPDDGDFPLPGVTVTLTDENGVTQNAVTDANGNYLFTDLPLDATYTVVVDTSTLPDSKITDPTADPDGVPDSTSEVTLTPANPDNLDQDFGYEPQLGVIGDTIWHDDDQDGNDVLDGDDRPIEGVVVNLLDSDGTIVASDTTDANGQYLFEDLPLGDYVVQIDTLTLPVAKQGNPAYDPDGNDDDQSAITLTSAAPDNLDQDFAYFAPPLPPTGSIGDTIFHDDDQDGNGVIDGDDEPIEGVVVNLLDSTGTIVATDTTDANGAYLFDEVPYGTYVVQVDTNTLPVAKQGNPAYDPDGGNDNLSTVTIDDAVPDNTDQDFAYFAPPVPTGSIGDTIFHDDDQDGNGVIDGDDEPIEGVVVNLLDSSGAIVATDTTDANGEYVFDNVPFGTYTVQIETNTLPVAKQGNSAYDPDGGNDNQATVTLDENTPDDLNQDFAYFTPPIPTGSIGDTIFHDDDQDGNGVIDGDDEPIAGVVVNLLDSSGAVIATDTTDANGRYLFEDVPYGTYTVLVDLATLPATKQGNPAYDPDGGNDNQSTVTLDASTPDDLSQDFAYYTLLVAGPAIQLQKTVYAGHNGGAGCPGGEIESGGNSAITYCFEVINIGDTYLNDIEINDDDIAITREDMTLISGVEPLAPSASMAFYYETTLTAELTNTADTSANPTDAAGADLPGIPDPTDSDIAQVKIAATLGDYVWLDKNANGIQEVGEPGLADIVVSLLDADRNVVDTTRTDEGGFYLFDNIEPGEYAIRVELPSAGYEFSPVDQNDDAFNSDVDPQTGVSIVTTLDPGEDDRTWDAGIIAAPNLNVEKNSTPARVQPGEVIIYNISYFNSGVGNSTGVMLTEVVPTNTTFVSDGSSPDWVCQDNEVVAGTVCSIMVDDLDAGQRSTDDIFFVVRLDEGIATTITSITNQVLISDDGTNGPSASGQTVDDATTEIQHPTSLDVDFEPGNTGKQTRQIFLPAVARNQFTKNGERVSLTVDQMVMSWVCGFMDNFGWISDACFISIAE